MSFEDFVRSIVSGLDLRQKTEGKLNPEDECIYFAYSQLLMQWEKMILNHELAAV